MRLTPSSADFTASSALLAAVLISDEVFGAKLAITVGSVSIQPTEFVKIIYVMFVAAMFNASDSFKRIVVTSLAAALHVVGHENLLHKHLSAQCLDDGTSALDII